MPPDISDVLDHLRKSGRFETEEIEAAEERAKEAADGGDWFSMEKLKEVMPDEETAAEFEKTLAEKPVAKKPQKKRRR